MVDAGVERTYVSRIERGMENPTVAVLEGIAAAPGPLPSGRKRRA